MEAKPLPPGQSVHPTQVSNTTPINTGVSAPVSAFSGTQKSYPIETLEVHQEGQPLAQTSYAPTTLSIPFSRRRATIVSLAITIVVLLITGLVSAFFVQRSSERPRSQSDIPTQDASIENTIQSDLPPELQGLENSLLVNGDIVTRGQLRVVSGLFTSSFEASPLTTNQTITLPNASGEICLTANNCNFATQAELAQIQPVAGVTTINTAAGGVTVQGSLNQIIVTTANGVITLSTPQNLDANANVQFGNLTLGALGTGPLRANNGSLIVGTINLSSSDVTGTVGVGNGGTGATTLTANGVLVGNGASPITAVSAGGSGLCLVSTVGAPTFQACPGGGGVSSLNALTGDLTLQGTANQINVVSGGSTITLSTPQDIATTSNVTFNTLTTTSNADVNGALAVGSNAALAPTTNALVVNHDITGDCSFGCSGITVTAEGTVAATWIWGVISSVSMTSNGTFSAAAYYAASATESGTGTIGDNYGVYVDSQTVGANDYGIYVEAADTYSLWIDSGISRFDGNLEFEGSSEDANELTVTVTNPTADRTITLPDESGTVCLRTSTLCGFALGSGTAFIQGGNNFGGTTAGTLGTTNNGDLNVITNNLTRLTVQADGDLAFDTDTLFGDAANNRVGIAVGAPLTTLHVGNGRIRNDGGILQLQGAVTAFIDENNNGGYIYASDSGGSGPFSGAGNLIIQPRGGSAPRSIYFATGGTGAVAARMEIQADGDVAVDNNVLFVDATNDRVGVGDTSPAYALTVGSGDLFGVNSSGNVIVTALGAASTDTVVCRNATNQLATCNSTFATGSGAAFLQGGNNFGGTTAGTLGTTNNGDLNVITNNLTRMTLQADGDIAFDTNTLFVNAASDLVTIGDITGSAGIELDPTDADFEDMPSLTFGPNSNKPWTFVVGGAGNSFDVLGEGNRIATFGLGGNFWVCCNEDAQDPMLAAANTVAAPGFTFSNDPDTGMYWVNTNQLGFSTGGANRLTLSSTGGAFAQDLAVNGGDITSSAATLNINAGSTIALQDNTTLPNGAVGTPALSFSGDTNTGLYWVAADQLGISTGGANQVTFGVDPTAAAFETGIVRITTVDSPTTGDFEIYGTGSEDLDIGSNSGMSLNINEATSGGNFSIWSGADEIFTLSDTGNIDTAGGSVTFIQGYLRLGASTFTPAGTEELIPDSSLVEVTCSNGAGCTPTLDEDFSSRGQTVRIVNVGANTVTINNTAGNVELAGSAAWVGSQWSTLTLVYVVADGTTGRWVELGRSVH